MLPLALLLLTLVPRQDGPGPRAAVDGVRALQALARVEFPSDPGTAYRLEVSLAFPARARSRLSREGGRESEQRIVYRFGDALCVHQPDAPASLDVPAEQRPGVLAELALRRALYLWPRGARWQADDLDPLLARAAGPDGVQLVLRRTDDSQPPHTLAALDHEGRELARFRAIEWEDGRPARFEFDAEGALVWREEVLALDLGARWLDAWFQPADRRPARPSTSSTSAVRDIDLHPLRARRVALEAPLAVEEARTAERTLRARLHLPDGARLDASVRLELDPAGLVAAVWFALAAEGSERPSGEWPLQAGRPALAAWCAGPEARVALLNELRTQAGSEGRTAALLWIQPVEGEPGAERELLVQPLELSR